MAAEQTAEQTATAPVPGPPAAPAGAEDVAGLPAWAQKVIKDARASDAQHRTEKAAAEKAAMDAKAAAEKAIADKAKAEGDWKTLAETKEKEAAAAKARADALSPYEILVKGQVDALRAALADKAAAVPADLPLAQQLPILQMLSTLASGRPGAPPTAAGNPAPAASVRDYSKLTPGDVKSLTSEQRRELLATGFPGFRRPS